MLWEMRELNGFGRADHISQVTHLPVLIPILLGIFVIFSIVATVRRILSKKREKFQKRRMEERYASEEKSSHGYQNMQSFEDVSDEFRGIFQKQESQRLKQSQILQKNQTNYRKRFQIPDKQKTR